MVGTDYTPGAAAMIVQAESFEVHSLPLHTHTVLCMEEPGCQVFLGDKTVHTQNTESGQPHLSIQTVPKDERFAVHYWQMSGWLDLDS